MWGKIKKFFKWIADHTGISWIARKISSGWKWLFGGKANATQQNTSQQEKSSGNERQEPAQAQSKGATTPKTLDDEVNPDQSIPPAAPDEPQGPVINTSETDAKELPENFPTPNPKNADSDVLKEASNENYLKVGDKGLLLVLTSEQFAKCKDYKDSQSTSPGGLLMYIKCGENEYRITGESVDKKTVSIESIKKKDENGQLKEISAEEILGNAAVKKVDSISNKPFGAPTLEQPKPNTTTTQQTVNNEGVATEPKKFFDAEDDGVTQPRSLTTDPAVEQSTSSADKEEYFDAEDDGVTQPTPSAVPNKSQDNSIVINGIVIPEGTKLKFFPEISDFLSRASLEREISFCKAPNSLLVQTREEQAADNDHSR